MIDKLISTTDFVKWLETEDGTEIGQKWSENKKSLSIEYDILYTTILNYANFISQPLELWMFIPSNSATIFPKDGEGLNNDEMISLYEEAKSKVLFDNIEVEDWTKEFGYITLKERDSLIDVNYDVKTKTFFFDGDSGNTLCNTIEDMLPGEWTISNEFLKRLNLT